ncbi:uncharacterized protein G2W53_007197 [Senna tora]|uniref:Uncharacterized protein n=1 Tax=Senna tora TaxID=362788 RepID=A0A834X698_9FABA|nr:uncharacterized protein G2W53_007197 [Senna tora]
MTFKGETTLSFGSGRCRCNCEVRSPEHAVVVVVVDE